jgi:hypothetical protein
MSTLTEATRLALTQVGQRIDDTWATEDLLRYAEVCSLAEQAEATGRVAEELRTANLLAMVGIYNSTGRSGGVSHTEAAALEALAMASKSLLGKDAPES